MRHLPAALLALLAFGCSIMDPGDRAELRSRIEKMPPVDQGILTTITMNVKGLKWLVGKDDNDQVMKIMCRDDSSGKMSDWYDRPKDVLTVAELKVCLELPGKITIYVGCGESWGDEVSGTAYKELEALLPAGTNIDCKYEWDSRYEPAKVDPKAIDPKADDIDDKINALVALPAPPPGWNIPEIAPLLCPLGAGSGWGCPPRPTDPTGGQSGNPTGGQPGDHP